MSRRILGILNIAPWVVLASCLSGSQTVVGQGHEYNTVWPICDNSGFFHDTITSSFGVRPGGPPFRWVSHIIVIGSPNQHYSLRRS